MELFLAAGGLLDGSWLQHLTGGDADPEERDDDGPDHRMEATAGEKQGWRQGGGGQGIDSRWDRELDWVKRGFDPSLIWDHFCSRNATARCVQRTTHAARPTKHFLLQP
jgi:hypothetical protein